jgi:NDP-sugar pyrophosphorylase family protein
MNKVDVGIILAAGKQTRLKSTTMADFPKALYPYKDKVILDINYETLSRFCKDVYIVVSYYNYKYFEEYDNGKYKDRLIRIHSGFGCGDAVYKVLNSIREFDYKSCFLIWGDSIQNNNEIFEKTLCRFNYSSHNELIIPVVFEQSPYVLFLTENKKIIKVNFSKKGDDIFPGFHDLSVFSFDIKYLYGYLDELMKNKKENDEVAFLDIINKTKIESEIVEIDNISAKSFNTMEEYLDINMP